MEAMFRFMAVIRTMVARQTRPPRQYKSYNVSTRQTIQVCRESVANSEDLQEVLPDLCQNLSSVQILFSAFKNDAAAKFSVFAFWNSYFDMIGLLLAFILAERNGDWLSHLSAVAAMVPNFYAMDRTNYARWLPVYLAHMNELSSTHPELLEEFLRGNHSLISASEMSYIMSGGALNSTHSLTHSAGQANHSAKFGLIWQSNSPSTLIPKMEEVSSESQSNQERSTDGS